MHAAHRRCRSTLRSQTAKATQPPLPLGRKLVRLTDAFAETCSTSRHVHEQRSESSSAKECQGPIEDRAAISEAFEVLTLIHRQRKLDNAQCADNGHRVRKKTDGPRPDVPEKKGKSRTDRGTNCSEQSLTSSPREPGYVDPRRRRARHTGDDSNLSTKQHSIHNKLPQSTTCSRSDTGRP